MLQLVTGNESLSCKVVADQQVTYIVWLESETDLPHQRPGVLIRQWAINDPVTMWSFFETMTDVFFSMPTPRSTPRSVGETKRFGLQDLGLIYPPVEIYLSDTANIKAQLMGLTFQSHLSCGTARAYVQRTA
jgi:hypothetical protein